MAAIDEANMTVPMMKLELVPVPVTDVDRAKAFYEQVGFLQEFPPEVRQPGQSFYTRK
jgi:predicted enzyme related to lactoylglutathione lyase